MASFKIMRGEESNLPASLTDGACWYCTDTSNFYIDYIGSDGGLVRGCLSSKYAEKLRFVEDGLSSEISSSDIITISNASTKLSDLFGDKVNKSGDTMTGSLILAADPTNNLEAATKQYVDSAIAFALATTQSYYTGTADPEDYLGSDGDIYLKTT